MKVPKTPTRGISARVPHTSLFVPFLDYDNITDERLDDELTYLQELFHLGDLHVFKTNEFGRHVIGTDCLRPRDCLDVLEASSCDWAFKRGIRINEYRTWDSEAGKGRTRKTTVTKNTRKSVQRIALSLDKILRPKREKPFSKKGTIGCYAKN